MGEIFQALLWQWGIRNAPISVSNPIKPMQFVRGRIKLWVILYEPPQDARNAEEEID